MIEMNLLSSRGKNMVCLIEYADVNIKGKKTIIFKHGFCGNKITPHRLAVNLSHQLVAEGFTVVRFDCVGAGDSEGDWHDMTISGEVTDYKHVIHWVVDNLNPQKLMLWGYSMGGLETAICSKEVDVAGLLFWSPVSQPYACFKHLLGDELFAKGLSGEDIIFTGDRVGREFFRDLNDKSIQALDIIKGFTKPAYFIHGEKDIDVLASNTQNYLNVLPQAKAHIIKNATHYFEKWDEQEELWSYSKKYIHAIMD